MVPQPPRQRIAEQRENAILLSPLVEQRDPVTRAKSIEEARLCPCSVERSEDDVEDGVAQMTALALKSS